MNELDSKSRNELIQEAKELLNEKHSEIVLNLNEFDIRVWNNEFNAITVIFRRIIRYASKEMKPTNYDIVVNLKSKEITPLDDDKTSFYQLSKKEENNIAELKKMDLLPNHIQPNTEYTITENNDYYLISCFNDLHHIDKKLITNKEHPFLSKSLVYKETGKTLFFKGINPFYFLRQKTFKHYYQENSYLVLNEETDTNTNNMITEMAYSILKSKHPHLKLNPKDFEIIILGNYKDLIVKYKRNIRYVNKKNDTNIKYDVAINIITQEVFPFEDPEAVFYIPSKSDLEAISFINDKITLSLASGIEHTIVENDNYYWISSFSKKEIKKYCINKKNNEISCYSESENLPVNNYEDLTFYEEYARGNQFFTITSSKKNELINMVLSILKEKQFISEINLKEYTITVKASKKEVLVKFDKLVRFVPLRDNNKYQYDLEVYLVNNTVTTNLSQFYFPSKEEITTTEFVEKQFKNYFSESEKIVYPITIIEELDQYKIKTYDFKSYYLNKKTGKIDQEIIDDTFYPTPARFPTIDTEITN